MSEPALRQTPLHDAHAALGARFVPFAGYAMPVQYGDGVLAEHRWTREHAGLFDVSHMGPALLALDRPTGDPRADYTAIASALERLLPADLLGLKPGRQRYSFLLNDAGGVIDDLMVSRPQAGRPQDRLLLVVNAGTKHQDFALIGRALAGVATVHPLADHALIALQGPEAAAVLGELVPETADMAFMDVRQLEWAATVHASSPASGGAVPEGLRGHRVAPRAQLRPLATRMPPSACRPPPPPAGEVAISVCDSHALTVSRSGYTGEDGFEILIHRDAAAALWARLLADERVRPIGLGARDSLRLEAGLPLYGHDLDETVSPVEAGLTFALSKRRLAEGGFPGAERIARELAEGPERIRVGLRVQGAPAREGAQIVGPDGRLIGIVSSGGFSPTLSAPIALAFVPKAFADPGSRLSAVVRDRGQPAEVVPLPFIPHRYVRRPQT